MGCLYSISTVTPVPPIACFQDYHFDVLGICLIVTSFLFSGHSGFPALVFAARQRSGCSGVCAESVQPDSDGPSSSHGHLLAPCLVSSVSPRAPRPSLPSSCRKPWEPPDPLSLRAWPFSALLSPPPPGGPHCVLISYVCA